MLEHLWTINILKGPKDCLYLHSGIFVIFFDHCEVKSARKTSILSQEKWESNGTNSNAFMSKSKNVFWILSCISRTYIKFRILWKNRWASEVIFFLNYRLQRAALLKCLKSPVLESLWTVNMLKGPKDH